MTDAPSEFGRRAAASYLRELLLRPGRYRRVWEQHAVRLRPGAINQLAVAEAVAQHLWNHPRAAGPSDVVAHQLKDTVARALTGRLVSRSALQLLIDTFGLTGQEKAMAAWARKVATDPNATTPADIQGLREAGLDDGQIFAITSFVALRLAFSTINDCLGAQPDAQLAASLPPEVREAVTYGRPVAT